MLKILKISLILVLLTSCGRYNKVLNKGTTEERYTLATSLYKEGDYYKSNRLFELILPSYQNKPQKEVIIFRLADGYFKVEDYITSIYYYEKFIRSFPKSTEIEIAEFKIAESYFRSSPKHSIDQKDTNKAIQSFQTFIDKNPDSDKVSAANQRINELNYKLETKAFEIAKLYYKIGNYKSAMVAFDNIIFDFLGTSYKEQALFYKFKSAYELGMNSIYNKKQERIKNALKVYSRYKKLFPNSDFIKEADDLYQKLTKEKQLLTKQIS
ncbi:MAG: outer membrane protein assembly factor BamD [Wenyingzhuangia sp.]|jgi:outer membrane protein assembly factor BamD|uniref:outer membrane protein assembly factor BamD n=1 Tax=Wenyingzhuangia sp. TaxID=1964193 RepID=UPI00321AEF16